MTTPANRQAVIIWSDLDDIISIIQRAKFSLDALDMIVEGPLVPTRTTDAAQEVCTHALSLLISASEALEALAARCNASSEGGAHHG